MKKSLFVRSISTLLLLAMMVITTFALVAADSAVYDDVPEGESLIIDLGELVTATNPTFTVDTTGLEGSFVFDSELGMGTYEAPSVVAAETTTSFSYEACEVDDAEDCAGNVITINLTPNNPPVCTEATASDDVIWSPNHDMVGFDIEGVTDEDDAIEDIDISVDSIEVDEPDNDTGDGNTTGDTDAENAEVRAERKGNGDGRDYTVHFTATDPAGASCSGEVTIRVPHDASELVEPPGYAYGLYKEKNTPNGNAYGHDEEHTSPNGNAYGHDNENTPPNDNAYGHNQQEQNAEAASTNDNNGKSDKNKNKDNDNGKSNEKKNKNKGKKNK